MSQIKKTVTPPTTIVTPVKSNGPAKITKPLTLKDKVAHQLFDRENLKWMLIGLIVIAVGFIVMAGGKSSNPKVFDDKDVYSFTRITIAPILIIAGFIIEIFAIMRKPAVKNIV